MSERIWNNKKVSFEQEKNPGSKENKDAIIDEINRENKGTTNEV